MLQLDSGNYCFLNHFLLFFGAGVPASAAAGFAAVAMGESFFFVRF